MGAGVPLNSACTPPMVVNSLPFEGSMDAYAAVAGPMAVPNRVTISPGEIAPLMKLAAFTTLLMVGSGAVTVRVTLMLVEPVAVPAPLTRIAPLYVPAPSVPGVAVTVTAAVPVVGVVPLVGDTESQLLPLVTAAVKLRATPPPETVNVAGVGLVPPAWYENDSVVAEVTVIVGAAVTVMLT